MQTTRKLLVTLLFVGILALPGSNSAAGASGPPTGDFNVVIVLIDTLRADRLTPEIMPHMDELSKKGARFNRAISQAPITGPSVASLFTGLYPSAHGLKTPQNDERYVSMAKLADKFDALAEAFQRAGYDTAMFTASGWISPELGFTQGFKKYEKLSWGIPKEKGFYLGDAKDVNKKALEWLAGRKSKKPFFLYLHYLDVHGPHEPPPKALKRFAAKYESKDNPFLRKLAAGKLEKDLKRNLKENLARYDANAAYTDEEIDRLYDALKAYSPENKTLFIFTSDHGEGFLEHGTFGHGNSVYREEIRIPLFFVLPGTIPEGLAFDELVELADVYPTLAEMLGLKMPDYEISGVSLAPAFRGVKLDKNRIVGSQCFTEWIDDRPSGFEYYERQAARRDNLKLIAYDETPPRIEIFNLADDPLERTNLNKNGPGFVHSMVNMYEKHLKAVQETGFPGHTPENVILDDETTEMLKSMGYLQ